MGTWGLQFDENDSAADWLGDFAEAPSWSRVHEAFNSASMDSGAYIEVDECTGAIAAAEVLAAGLGKPSSRLDSAVAEWAIGHPEDANELKIQAQRTVLYLQDNGELSELWHEGGEHAEWLSTIEDLLARLQ